jgi:hypothetical protein
MDRSVRRVSTSCSNTASLLLSSVSRFLPIVILVRRWSQMRDDLSRRTILGSVAGALGTVAGVGFTTKSHDPSEQSDSVAPVSSEGDVSPRWIPTRHLRHYEGGRYGMTGIGNTTRLLHHVVDSRAIEEW